MRREISAKRPLRIAYVIRDMRLGGGTENHLMQLFEHLDRQRFDPALYCLWRRGELVERVRAMGIDVFDGAMRGSLLRPSLLPGIVRFARAFRARGVDVVHTFLPRGELVGSVAARLARVPVLLCGKRGCHYRRGAEAAGARISNYLADRVVANALAVREFVSADESCPTSRIVVVENGVDTRRFAPVADERPFKQRLGLDPERPVVGTITRARVRKGYEEFLHATADAARLHPDLQVVVVGQDTKEQAPHALIDELGLRERLHLLGTRTDIPDVLSAFDIFVLSSHDEGMSNAVMEAMAAGRAVVVTNVGGAPELIRDGVAGILVPPKEVPPLEQALLRLLAAPEVGRAMGREARRVIEERFSIEVMVRRMESLYETLWAMKHGDQKMHGNKLVQASEKESSG